MKTRFKISELAKMFGISKQTLIFYHKKGILIPDYIDPENSYRYYSNTQVWDLLFILTLKEAEFSLNEIQKYASLKKIDKSIEFLEKKTFEIDEKIKILKKSKEKINKKILSLKEVNLNKHEEIEIVEESKKYWYKIKLKNKTADKEIVETYETLRKLAEKNKISSPIYITKTNLNDFKKGEIIPVEEIGILVEEVEKFSEKDEIKELENGKFLKVKHKAEYDSLEKTYSLLIEEIIENYSAENLIFYEFASEILLPMENGIGGIAEIFYKINDN